MRQVLNNFQDYLVEQAKVPELVQGSLNQQIIINGFMTMEKVDKVVEQIEDSNKDSVRSCLHDMLLQREEKITSALIKMGLRNTVEELKGQQ